MMKKVLAVDDDEDILEALQLVLESNGYDAATITKGEETYKMVDEFKPDLILLDVLLSGRDGRTICRKLKDQESTKHIPIIMLSAHPEAAKTIHEYGADEFIAKPFEMKELLAMVEKHVT